MRRGRRELVADAKADVRQMQAWRRGRREADASVGERKKGGKCVRSGKCEERRGEARVGSGKCGERPTCAKKPSLLTCVTTASKTSPLKGRKTIALNRIGKVASPPPAPTRSRVIGWVRIRAVLIRAVLISAVPIRAVLLRRVHTIAHRTHSHAAGGRARAVGAARVRGERRAERATRVWSPPPPGAGARA